MSNKSMELALKAFAFVIGAIFGSFGNVLIYRLPKGMSIVKPPSHCPVCGKRIAWYDNIPILSYIILGGSCRHCKATISLRYPVVELLAAVLSVVAFLQAASGPWPLLSMETGIFWLLEFAFFFALLVITFVDLEHMEVPYLPLIIGTLAGVGVNIAFGPYMRTSWLDSVIGIAAGAVPALLVVMVYRYAFKREGMGLGDVFIFGMVGAFVGYKPMAVVYFLSSLQGLAAALIYFVAGGRTRYPEDDLDEEERRKFEEDAEKHPLRLMAVPFGPFIALSALEWVMFQGFFVRLINRIFGI